MRLQGKVAIVTGAARGIGLAIAQRFVKEGARVVLADRLAAEVETEAGRLGASALAVPADVGDAAEVRRLVSRTVERFGRLDCMVSNAAVQAEIPFLDLTEEEFDRVIRVNLKGAFPVRADRGASHGAGGRPRHDHQHELGQRRRGAPGAGPLRRLEGRHRHADQGHGGLLAPHGIRVNGIGPGTVNTPINANFFSMPGMIERFLMRTPARAHRRGRRDRERRGVPGLGRVVLRDRHHHLCRRRAPRAQRHHGASAVVHGRPRPLPARREALLPDRRQPWAGTRDGAGARRGRRPI